MIQGNWLPGQVDPCGSPALGAYLGTAPEQCSLVHIPQLHRTEREAASLYRCIYAIDNRFSDLLATDANCRPRLTLGCKEE